MYQKKKKKKEEEPHYILFLQILALFTTNPHYILHKKSLKTLESNWYHLNETQIYTKRNWYQFNIY